MIQELDADRIITYYNLTSEETLERLKTDKHKGLTSLDASNRSKLYGFNELPSVRTKSQLERFWGHFNSVFSYILLVGAILSFGFNHIIDGVVIICVIFINVFLGHYMEGEAENTTKKMKTMMSFSSTVLRDEEKKTIESKDITVGDIFFLSPGDIVPADGRIIASFDLAVHEAALTGESEPVNKNTDRIRKKDLPLAERTSMVYSGTMVIRGTATCICVRIGSDCEIGKINGLLQRIETTKTPLIIQLEKFEIYLAIGIVIIACVALGIAIGRGYSVSEAFSFSIGISVAAIPEGLPSCVTIIFAIGIRAMAIKNAIIKSLPDVETLGSVSVICSDKTGTLTLNVMKVKAICSLNSLYFLSDEGKIIEYIAPGNEISVKDNIYEEHEIIQSISPGIFCNSSSILLSKDVDASQTSLNTSIDLEEGNQGLEGFQAFTIRGEPTESAILACAVNLISPKQIKRWKRSYRRQSEIPFDSSTKFMASKHTFPRMEADYFLGESAYSIKGSNETVTIIFVKGAPEKIFEFCDGALDYWTYQSSNLASKGMRVLALGFKVVSNHVNIAQEMTYPSGFTITGLLGLLDPPRPEVIQAIKSAQQAGITIKMITGDHPGTATSIGKMIGIKTKVFSTAITGAELDLAINENQNSFDKIVVNCDIFARTTPEHKLRIVESLQRQGFVCCMTGDGVNDAPALKASHIGVAMGVTGTEVAKDAANMIITDDNFATIVDAIRTGRCTYTNLIKVLAFVLPANGGQAFCIIIALIINVPVPITALQILWVNMITSITLGLVLAFEKPHDEIMNLPPRRPGKSIFGKFLSWRVIFITIILVCIVLGNFQWEKQRISSLRELRTISVNNFTACQISYLFNCRSLRRNIGFMELCSGNKFIFLGILSVAGFQAIFTYAPPFQYLFQTASIDGEAWGKIIFWMIVVNLIVEFEKVLAQMKETFLINEIGEGSIFEDQELEEELEETKDYEYL